MAQVRATTKKYYHGKRAVLSVSWYHFFASRDCKPARAFGAPVAGGVALTPGYSGRFSVLLDRGSNTKQPRACVGALFLRPATRKTG